MVLSVVAWTIWITPAFSGTSFDKPTYIIFEGIQRSKRDYDEDSWMQEKVIMDLQPEARNEMTLHLLC